MQNAMSFEDVKGNEYEAFLRPIGQWNCRHVRFPIIIGISEPVHSEEQLKEFAENSKKKYDLTQQQRAMETKLRSLKTQRLAASAAGDELEAKRLQRKINEQQTIYRRFSEKHGLLYDTQRASVEGYRRISVQNTENITLRNLKSVSNDDIISTVHKNNIIDAMKYANGNLMINTYGYQNMSIESANMVNSEIKKCYTIFGDLKNKGVLRAIRVVSDDKFDSVAAYSPVAEEIFLKKGYVNSIDAKKEMLAISKVNFAAGFWSTGVAEHQIRHELGHAIEQTITKDTIKMEKISSLFHRVIEDCGITKWSIKDREHFDKAAEYLSYYGLKDESEFIAESVAEYLNGNPRDVSNAVIKIILGSDA